MNATESTAVKKLAAEVAAQFVQAKRANGDEYWKRKDGAEADDWVKEMCFKAHGDMMPDDWKYEFIVESLNALADADDPEDVMLEADVYTHDRLRWLASHLQRPGYCDEEREDGLVAEDADIVTRVGAGQVREKEEVLASVRESLLERVREQGDDEEADDAAE